MVNFLNLPNRKWKIKCNSNWAWRSILLYLWIVQRWVSPLVFHCEMKNLCTNICSFSIILVEKDMIFKYNFKKKLIACIHYTPMYCIYIFMH